MSWDSSVLGSHAIFVVYGQIVYYTQWYGYGINNDQVKIAVAISKIYYFEYNLKIILKTLHLISNKFY